LICSIVVTLAGFFIIKIGGKSKHNKLLFHRVVCGIFRFLAEIIPQVKHKIHNPYGEDFEKPAVIICNHQSQLDLMYTLLLSPKIITLTNKWVWNSPFYGRIIRYADFLPINDGIEQHIDTLKTVVDNGYSILVFPEGTRSEDCSIGRFHKGAFYLAEQLKLDVLPIVIHGIGHVFPKKEFMLKNGEVNIFVEKRVNLSDIKYEKEEMQNITPQNYASKHFRRFYKKRYAEIVEKIETPRYFADKVLKNYIYKGAEVEKNAKKELKTALSKMQNLKITNFDTSFLIENNGYGVFSLLFALVHKNAVVYAVEENDDLRTLAQNNISNPANLIICQASKLPKNIEFERIG